MNSGNFKFALFLMYGFGCSRLFRGTCASTMDRHDDGEIEITEYKLDDEYNNEHGDDDYLSGDYEIEFPRVAFSTKSKDMPMAQTGDRKTKRKGQGKKRNPCLRKYKDFCIHGVCHYLRELREPSCICQPGYYGERCHLFSLSVTKEAEGNNRNRALAGLGVILSLLSLTVAAIFLAIRHTRYHKQGEYSDNSEDKVKLEAAAHP